MAPLLQRDFDPFRITGYKLYTYMELLIMPTSEMRDVAHVTGFWMVYE